MGQTAQVSNDDEVQSVESVLRDQGWAKHASLAREALAWARLAAQVNTFALTVHDYTNQLCSRDYLAAATALASEPLRTTTRQQVATIDDAFIAVTVEDADGRLAEYHRVETQDGWGWRRRPTCGPLADFLSEAD